MSDDPIKELARIARERETERERFERDPVNRALLAPISREERAQVVAKVVGRPAPAPRILAFTAGLALAAAVLVIAVIPRTGSLPEYDLEIPSIAYSSTRSEPVPGEVLQLKRGMVLELVLRPRQAVEGAIDARVYANGEPLAWEAELAPTGAVRFSGSLGGEVDLPNGRCRLKVVLERGGVQRTMEIDVEVLD